MKKIFRRIGDFAKACAEKVLSRFEYRGLWAHAAIFNLTYQFDQNSFQTSVFEIATSLNIEFEDVLPEMRRIFAQRDSLLNSHTFKSSQDLWCRVLKEVASEHMPHAKGYSVLSCWPPHKPLLVNGLLRRSLNSGRP